MLVARNKDKLEATAADVRSVGAEAKVYDLDLREPQAAEIVIKGTLERFGRIDALLNIAGAVPQIDAFEMTDAQWDHRIVSSIIIATLLCISHLKGP
jgi:3-oxoacyl-[acyl-carrier protein] reductase